MAEERKVTPLHLRERYGLNIAKLALQAKISPSTVYFMMVGCPIARQHAEHILATISAEIGQSYTLDNVAVALVPEEQEQTESMDGVPSSHGETTA